MESRKRHTKEFKVEAVRLLESSERPGHRIEEEPGIGRECDFPPTAGA